MPKKGALKFIRGKYNGRETNGFLSDRLSEGIVLMTLNSNYSSPPCINDEEDNAIFAYQGMYIDPDKSQMTFKSLQEAKPEHLYRVLRSQKEEALTTRYFLQDGNNLKGPFEGGGGVSNAHYVFSEVKAHDQNLLRNVKDLEGNTVATFLVEPKDGFGSLCESPVTVDIIKSRLAKLGRPLDKNDVANLMICLTQGFVTTLCGLPGTGKTSLTKLLAKALGLEGDEEKAAHFVKIGVERGWTSYKDLIGFYNSITREIVKSNAELYGALKSAKDSENASEHPWLFLLDEANLSSPEHYWAPFLGYCDSFEDGPLDLQLGGEESLRIPSSARFLCTVNFDHTTEELSPRFLDRSWVIMLDADGLELEKLVDSSKPSSKAEGDSPKPVVQVTTEQLRAAFGWQDKDDVKWDDVKEDAEQSLEKNVFWLTVLIKACSDNDFHVSPRSQLMMYRYILAAVNVMNLDKNEGGYQLAPVDYAFSQKVLPQICGDETTLHDLMAELHMLAAGKNKPAEGTEYIFKHDEKAPMPLTAKRLERMHESGKTYGVVQYFA